MSNLKMSSKLWVLSLKNSWKNRGRKRLIKFRNKLMVHQDQIHIWFLRRFSRLMVNFRMILRFRWKKKSLRIVRPKLCSIKRKSKTWDANLRNLTISKKLLNLRMSKRTKSGFWNNVKMKIGRWSKFRKIRKRLYNLFREKTIMKRR